MLRMLKSRPAQSIMILLVAIAAFAASAAPARATALDDYVAAPDPSYSWSAAGKSELSGGVTLRELDLTSQTWQGIAWQHRLQVAVPSGGPQRKAVLMYITGSESDPKEQVFLATLAKRLSAPVAILYGIPNQPLYSGLREDALVSYTFAKFLETGDVTWPLLFPMVKGAVRAMDAISEFTARDLGWSVDGFVVFGASKRGWTTWLAAAVDQRVRAIAPIAYDNLSLAEQMAHQEKRFGCFSDMISDYTDRGLQAMLQTTQGRLLAHMVDPYSYKDRYTLPKLIIRGSNDPYWPVDAMQLYIHSLPGETWLHIDPNAGHGLADYERVLTTLSGFYLHALGSLPLRPLHTTFSEDRDSVTLTVKSATPSSAVNLWQAQDTTPDFREARWDCQSAGPGSRTFTISRPSTGFTAAYGEIVYRIFGMDIVLDTPVYVIEPAR
jgi:PhoPQ-activated pathogenicity-related protein